MVSYSELPGRSSMSSDPFQVKIKHGPAQGKRYKIREEALVFGSGQEADVVLQAPGVEPLHAELVFQGGQVMLRDLGTQSGTFRNGQRLLGPLQVFPGDRIGLGPEVELILEGDEPRESASEKSLEDELGLSPDEAENA
jgi:pSer/pThr/pTyr-binding forkhead associated (FHA) protein